MGYYRRIVGSKVYLSPVDGTDFQKCTSWMNDINSTIRIGMAHRSTNESSERAYLESKKDDDHFFGIVLQETNELVGTCGLLDSSFLHRTATVGILIGEDKFRNLGLGSEAMNLLLSYCFQILSLNNVMLKVFEFNKSAIRSYQKSGFSEFGRRSQCYLLDGKFYDEIFMEILSANFKDKRIQLRT